MSILRFLWFPTLILATIFFWLWLDSAVGWRGPGMPGLGTVLLLLGTAIILWTNGLFLSRGEGTAHPFTAKTKRLVIVGPYRYVRNPMMWGVGTLLAGPALSLGSLGLWFGLAMFVTFVTIFVPYYEERDMLRRFGDDYRRYCQQVPRWFPHLPKKR